MQLAIHQPEFMPWLGFFYKMVLADLYVLFDHVQFKKRYYENRNRVVSSKREISYINIPVISKGRYEQPIREVEVDNTQHWRDTLLKKIQHTYGKAPYFKKYYDELCLLVSGREYQYLIEFNIEMINFFRRHLGISTPLAYSSNMDVSAFKDSDLILQICRLQNADIYLCGASGRDYLKLEDFTKNNIAVKWLDYISPVYKQLCDDFAPNMSTLDLLFNCGERSLDILMKKEEGREINLC